MRRVRFLISSTDCKEDDPQYADETYLKFLNDTMSDAALDTSVGHYGTGFGRFGWAHVEGSEFSTCDAANEWIQSGDAVDLNGSSPNCAWRDADC